MKNFDALQDQHEKLLGQESNGADILEDVQAYIEQIRYESRNISSPQEREQLRANIRYWATYVFEKTNLYPNTELAPFSGERPVPNIINTLRANPITTLGLILVVGVIITILVIIPTLGSIEQGDTPTSTPTLETIAEFTPDLDSPTPTATPTSTPTPTPIPTSTATSTPEPTSTPLPTPTSTPPPLFINSLSDIAQENIIGIEPITSLIGHSGAVLHVAFSPDGRQLASVGADGTLRIWDLNFDKTPIVLKVSQSGWTQSVTYSPDGRWIAAGGNDRIINIFNTASQTLSVPQQDAIQSQPFAQFEGHEGFIFGLAFHPDSTKLASGSGDGDLKVWDIIAGGLITSIHLSDNAVLDLSFNSTGSLLAVANLDGGLWILDETLRTICHYPNESIIALAFSNNDDALFVGNNKGEVVRIDPQTCQVQERFSVHTDLVNSVATSPDEDIIVSGSRDNTLVVIPGEVSLTGHTDSVESVAFSPQGNLIASASADGTIILWGIPEN